jgi:hypothetical protein
MENNILIFPTFIKKYDNFLNKKECEDIVEKLKKIPLKNHPDLTLDKSYSSHYLFNKIHSEFGNKFYNNLMSIINKYAKEYGYKKLVIDNSWHNIQYKNSSLTAHCHENSIVSGVLYLKVDKFSSKLCFYNPNPYVQFTKYEENNIFNFKNYCFEVENGSLILFPSWLQHGSGNQENKSYERICFSFNTKQE